MIWTIVFALVLVMLYWLHPYLSALVIRKAVGIALFLEVFYVIGSLLSESWPFPTPLATIQILIAVGLGVALGVVFSRVWPLAKKPGFERIVRTLLIFIPSLGLGIGLQMALQGRQPTQAIYLIFALSTWLGSGHFIRKD
ncbi:hypothetical protein MFMK1_003408 [Metallumcola ferriviriculae]|uniref:Uncharacterized protein n=1 Tax=Metallumcola ferriviriculae TaxID=3039180 RepID=A0AAU0URV0_9FIRM|nr:hypothetical protein MFMK1_003408 [Desulfitibacteraceae bacterium MK1]